MCFINADLEPGMSVTSMSLWAVGPCQKCVECVSLMNVGRHLPYSVDSLISSPKGCPWLPNVGCDGSIGGRWHGIFLVNRWVVK